MEIMNLKINNLRKLEARLWPIVSFMSVKFVPKKRKLSMNLQTPRSGTTIVIIIVYTIRAMAEETSHWVFSEAHLERTKVVNQRLLILGTNKRESRRRIRLSRRIRNT